MTSQTKAEQTEAAGWTRRRFIITLGAASAAAAGLTALPGGAAWSDEDAKTVEEEIKRLMGGKELADGAKIISMDLPQIAENGNTVPLEVSVESPMTEADHVTTVHIVADGNPRPGVASFHFSPLSGRAQASTRMRLAKTQNVIAIAEMSDGKAYMTKAEVKVTIGGCGG